jgi:hypothetical protein
MPASSARCLALAAVVVGVALGLTSAPAAKAGTYRVYGCHIYGQPTHDLGAYNAPRFNAWDDCAAGRELNSVAEVNSSYGFNEEGGWAAYAPPGTVFRHVEVNAREQRWNSGGGAGMVTVGYVCANRHDRCSISGGGGTWMLENGTGGPMLGVSNQQGNGQWGTYRNYQYDGAADVAKFGFFCGFLSAPGAPCSNRAADKFWLKLSSVNFLVDDLYVPNAPSVGGHLGGTASDYGGGVSQTRFSLGGAAVTADFAHGCDRHPSGFNRLQPCPTNEGYGFSVDTTRVADGAHTLQVWSVDPSGAEGPRATQTVHIDNTAPAAPTGLVVVGGDGWRSSRSFAVGWTNPGGQHAPIAGARWQLCRTGGACTTGTGSGAAATTVQVPDQAGDYTLRVWLEDAAGNSNGANLSDAVHLRYDPTAPGKAVADSANGWVSAAEASDFPLPLTLVPNAVEPLSGIAGYSITTDGSHPDTSVEASGRKPVYRVASLPEGIFTIKVRAVSGAGVGSAAVGEAAVKVDKSPPEVAAAGVPDQAVWVRGDVEIALDASDQAHLSGMSAAPAGSPLEDGGHVVYRIDGGPPMHVRGSRATAKVVEDGRHALTYYAVDVAGNVSVKRTVEFKIDRSAPETVAFESQDPVDPRMLSVRVEDRLSGVASGQIAARAATGGPWVGLATTLIGNRLVARIDDALPDGNERTTDRRMDGGKMELRLPLRLASKTTIGATSTAKPCAKRTAKAKKQGTKKRCRAKAPLRDSAVVKVGYGKRQLMVGRVQTTDGRAIPGAAVRVEAVNRTGGEVRPVGETRAGAGGEFAFTLPAGPSRSVRFVYDGDNLIRASAAEARTRVPAALKFRVNRSSVRNGESVMFRGQLVGRPIPQGGKVVSIQARVPGGWRTFANPTTDRRGRFSHRYQFTATTGFQRYAIRALVQADASYSYEQGISKPVVVRVRGL